MNKICSLCEEEKDLSEFHKSKTKKFGVQDRCKACYQGAARIVKERVCPVCNNVHQHYQVLCKECNATQRREWVRVKKKVVSEKIYEHLGYDGCVVCGNTDQRVHCFHHRKPQDKDFEISQHLRKNHNLDKILREVDKCDLMCRNCHAIIHIMD